MSATEPSYTRKHNLLVEALGRDRRSSASKWDVGYRVLLHVPSALLRFFRLLAVLTLLSSALLTVRGLLVSITSSLSSSSFVALQRTVLGEPKFRR